MINDECNVRNFHLLKTSELQLLIFARYSAQMKQTAASRLGAFFTSFTLLGSNPHVLGSVNQFLYP